MWLENYAGLFLTKQEGGNPKIKFPASSMHGEGPFLADGWNLLVVCLYDVRDSTVVWGFVYIWTFHFQQHFVTSLLS